MLLSFSAVDTYTYDFLRLNVFQDCHSIISPSDYMDECRHQICSCLDNGYSESECKCNALNNYVDRCLEDKTDARVISWRSSIGCSKFRFVFMLHGPCKLSAISDLGQLLYLKWFIVYTESLAIYLLFNFRDDFTYTCLLNSII